MNNNDNNLNETKLIPVITYSNAYLDKPKIYEDNKKKQGIYR